MATEIRVPTLGESVTEATIGKWFKKVGDAIAADEPLVELETDKVTVEVPAPAAGMLAEITAKEGETVGVGALLGAIGGRRPAQSRRSQGRGGKPPTKPEAVAQAPARPAHPPSRKPRPRPRKIAGEAPIEERKMPPAPAAAKLLAESQSRGRSGRRVPASAARC